MSLKLTIIETGLPPLAIRDKYPKGYPAMFEALFRRVDPDMTFETVALESGDALPDPETLEAILITGSAYGVYDDVPWMRTLEEWIGFAAEQRVPMLGICFGHQVIASALGGDVRKAVEKGWGVGRHTIRSPAIQTGWCRRPRPRCWRQPSDQVLSTPIGAEVLAGNDFAPHAALVYSRAPILSFQGHPEFSDEFLMDLYEARKGNPLTQEQVDQARESFSQPDDNTLMAKWMADFLKANLRKS